MLSKGLEAVGTVVAGIGYGYQRTADSRGSAILREMANTAYLRREVEKHVRGVLEARYGIPFTSQVLKLRTGGRHEFDATSVDRRIVVSVKTASGLTAGGKNPSGKVKDCLAELYYLSLVDAPERILVLTTPAFYAIFTKVTAGAVAEGIAIECIQLPAEIQAEVDRIVAAASREVSPAREREAVATEVEAEIT